MSSTELVSLAILLEAAGIGALLAPGDPRLLLVLFFTAHAGASALLALMMTRFVPAFFPETERSPFGYFAALSFFLPVLGLVAMLLLVASARFAPSGPRAKPYEIVAAPRYTGETAVAAPAFNRAGIRPVLESASAPLDLKLKALVALQSLSSRAANDLIRRMLGEPVDDMRLVAYGLLDAREKALDARIHGLKQRLETPQTLPAARVATLKELAESYWELVYSGIVQGDLLRHCISESRRYLSDYLARAPADPGAWALQGRLLALERRDAEADQAFGRAIELGMSEARVLPYRAELAFRAREFDRVRAFIRQLGAQPANSLAAVARYWSGDDAPR